VTARDGDGSARGVSDGDLNDLESLLPSPADDVCGTKFRAISGVPRSAWLPGAAHHAFQICEVPGIQVQLLPELSTISRFVERCVGGRSIAMDEPGSGAARFDAKSALFLLNRIWARS
jgi:hypothetical protein